MRLFVFDHCPFCVRALLAAGLKSVPVEVKYILEDDLETPTKMIGKQMVPILEYAEGKYMPESLDIVKYLDENHGESILTEIQNPLIDVWINEHFMPVNKYVMPRYATMSFPEFATESARNTYITRHEAYFGSFDELLAQSSGYKILIEKALVELTALLDIDHLEAKKYSLDDILLFPLLRALTSVKDLVFPEKVLQYTKILSERGNLPLYFDQAR